MSSTNLFALSASMTRSPPGTAGGRWEKTRFREEAARDPERTGAGPGRQTSTAGTPTSGGRGFAGAIRDGLSRRKCSLEKAGLPPPPLLPRFSPRRRKMLLELSEEHREHLSFLPKVDYAVVAEFGRIALEFLRKGSNPKVYEGAARKLNVSSNTVQHGVEGLTYLLTESSKLMISELDFQDSVLVLGFSEDLNKLLLQLYLDHRKEIRTILSELAPVFPSYHNLEWRLDVQLASRCLRQQIKPAMTLKLHLSQDGEHSNQVLQTDPATLLHLIQQLEQALGEMKTNHCRRIVRNIK